MHTLSETKNSNEGQIISKFLSWFTAILVTIDSSIFLIIDCYPDLSNLQIDWLQQNFNNGYRILPI